MTDPLAGIERPCPRCDARPDEPCRNQYGRERITTHPERKPKEPQ